MCTVGIGEATESALPGRGSGRISFIFLRNVYISGRSKTCTIMLISVSKQTRSECLRNALKCLVSSLGPCSLVALAIRFC